MTFKRAILVFAALEAVAIGSAVLWVLYAR